MGLCFQGVAAASAGAHQGWVLPDPQPLPLALFQAVSHGNADVWSGGGSLLEVRGEEESG